MEIIIITVICIETKHQNCTYELMESERSMKNLTLCVAAAKKENSIQKIIRKKT